MEALTVTDDESASGSGPGGRAMRTGEIQVMNVDDPAFAPWREAARERGVASVAAVPLQHGDAVYGILVVYATREDAFSPREQAGFDAIGHTVGLVIHAARSRNRLVADSVVELEFRIEDWENALVRAAADCDCSLSLEGYVSSGDRWIVYFGVEGASPEAVVAAVETEPRVERGRTIMSQGDGRVELVVPESPLLDTVTDAGVTIGTAIVDPTGTRLVIESPTEADVRGVVDHIRTAYPDASLLANQERDRTTATRNPPGGLLDELTDRQHEVLETAYRAGYYTGRQKS
ncbi:MAG: bacterio-opsin activator domain-containing protein [Halobacteriales archaeon]